MRAGFPAGCACRRGGKPTDGEIGRVVADPLFDFALLGGREGMFSLSALVGVGRYDLPIRTHGG